MITRIDASPPVCRMIETTIEIANTRTPSASDRVIRKIAAVTFLTRGPKRRCMSS